MEYWHDLITEESWRLLQKLKGQFDFVLIGGWAVYLWAKKNKSRDIDIIVSFETLSSLKKTHNLRKNDNLRKYEIKEGNIDVDIYLPGYSKLGLALDEIKTSTIEGFVVAKPEELLVLKQCAEHNRRASEKGEKDRIDIMSILINCDIDFSRYNAILLQNKVADFRNDLISILRNFSEYKYLGLNPRQFKLRKKELLDKIKK